MKGDLKARTKNQLSHIQFVKVYEWCKNNVDYLKEKHYPEVAKTASAFMGFEISHSSIGDIARELGIQKAPRNGHAQASKFLGAGNRGQAVYEALEDLYESLGMRTEARNKLRANFGTKPL